MKSIGILKASFFTSLLCLLLLNGGQLAAQGGTIKGRIIDSETKEPLIAAKVIVVGTYKGALSDGNGNFVVTGVDPGDYSVQGIYDEYIATKVTGVSVKAGQVTTTEIPMKKAIFTTKTVEIIGKSEIINLEDAKSGALITAKDLEQATVRNVQEAVAQQAGVSLTVDGIQIRGGRVYETTYLVDGISAQDRLAGTGFGVGVGSNAIGEIDLITGGGDAEFGNGTAGVINTKIKEGGKKLKFSGSWYRDNLGFNPINTTSWNTDFVNLNLGGPIRFKKPAEGQRPSNKVNFFTSIDARLTDTYFGEQANQLHSSLFPSNDSMWAPRQDNHWANTIKVTWNIKPGMKISVTNQHSLNINQNSRSLQIVGNDAILRPGFPYLYSLNLDNANTYTHHSNLTAVNFKTALDSLGRWGLSVSAGRLFTSLRADANGRPFRESTVDRIYDPASIVTDPVTVFNPQDSVVYVFPGPGLYNNDGLGTLWHDHHAEEYTVRYKFTYSSKKKVHLLAFGHEHKEQEYQWVDVTRPWVGAPIVIDDSTTTPSTSIGSSSDFWLARPAQGGLFFQDEIRYKGIIAYLGARLDYWAPGKFADDAVANPDAPVVDEVRRQYEEQTTPFLGRRWKARFLPKIRVSFPVTSNNVLYFNYGHSTQLPHPRFVYAGLDPVYQDRSFLSNLGNPNINPEVTVNYELGLKSKITKDLALTLTAFYNDKFDYIVSRRIVIKDQTGRFVEKTFFINQDYARIRGIELGITQRIGDIFKVVFNGGYQIATGKSNTAAESALQIRTQGFVNSSKEQFLAWDRPLDFKLMVFATPDTNVRLFGLSLKGFRFYMAATLKSGMRYTPYEYVGDADNGRPLYEPIVDEPFSKIAAPWFWTDLRLSRDIFFGRSKESFVSLSFEVKNLFNNRNSQIINGVTGKAYEEGDPVPSTWRDPSYPDPQDNGQPPFNPARYLNPRQLMFGLTFKL